MLASQLITAVRRKIDDPDVPTDAQILVDLNTARNILASETHCFLSEYTRSSLATALKFTMPTDVVDISKIQMWVGNTVRMLTPITEKEYRNYILSETNISHASYWKTGRDIFLVPRLSASAGTEVLSAAITTATATIFEVTGTVTFRSVGRVLIDSEVIGYIGWSYSSTTGVTTFSNCTRGEEGTVPATHLITATVTERNIVTDCFVLPDPLYIGAFSTTLTGDHNATVTTITVASNATFPTAGKLLIDSEVISYTGKSSTTGFTGCLRGRDGTTAAAHTGTAVVTDPNSTVEPQFAMCNDALVLVFYAAWQAKVQDTDDVQVTGAFAQAEMFRGLYEIEKLKFKQYATSANYNSRDKYDTIEEVCE